jgi:lysophospholipase
VSRDPEVCRAYDADPLRVKVATARWYTELLGAQRRVLAEASRFRLPLLVVQAGDDRIVDPDLPERWVAATGSPDKRFRRWPGLYHEVMNEPEKRDVLGEIAAWIVERTRGG